MYSWILSLRDPKSYPKGLSKQQTEKLSQLTKELFDCELPKEYMDFLQFANGFIYEGDSIFGYYTEDLNESFPVYKYNDLIEFNKKRDNFKEYLFLGMSSTCFLVYEKASKKYLLISDGALIKLEESYDFNEILKGFFLV